MNREQSNQEIPLAHGDDEFFDAMVELALWRSRNPDPSKDEPAEITARKKVVMLRLAQLKEGEVDPWMGRNIAVLVRKSTRYIVYLDDELDVQWWWTHRLPQEADLSVVQANVTRLIGASTFLLDEGSDLRRRATPWRARWSKLRRASASGGDNVPSEDEQRWRKSAEQIRLLTAESMAMLLNHAPRAECEKVQEMAEQQILVAKDQVCRGVFFWQFVLALMVLLGVTIVAKWIGPKIWPDEAPGTLWYFAAIAGAFGAFLSAVSRTRALMLEPDSGLRGLRMEAYARALIGAGAGILVYFAFESGLIVKAAASQDPDIQAALKMFLCIASGWSERILPSLMSRAETMVAGEKVVAKDKPAVQP